jgi:hypothetical protein
MNSACSWTELSGAAGKKLVVAIVTTAIAPNSCRKD